MKIVKELNFTETYNLCKISKRLQKIIFVQKSLTCFDLSKFCLFDEIGTEIIDELSPTIKNVTLNGVILDLHLFQRFGDIVVLSGS